MNAQQLFEAGQLSEAIQSLQNSVKSDPQNIQMRYLLAELLCMQRDWERADKQFAVLMELDPAHAYAMAINRQLVRAEIARQECYQEGRAPELFIKPKAYITTQLLAFVEFRQGAAKLAKTLLEQANGAAEPVRISLNQQDYNNLCDLDDLCSRHFEVFTLSGNYYWLPFSEVKQIKFNKVKRPLDLIWRQAEFVLQDERSFAAIIPAIYGKSSADADMLMGRSTDWIAQKDGPTYGMGLRIFLAGDDTFTIHEIDSLSIEVAYA